FDDAFDDAFDDDVAFGMDLPLQLLGLWLTDDPEDSRLRITTADLIGFLSGTEDLNISKPDPISLPEIGLLALLNDPGFILDGIDLVLGEVQDVMGSNFAEDLPLVGSKLSSAATFIRDLRLGLLGDLREKLEQPGSTVAIVQETLWDTFGPGGLDILLDRDGDGQISVADIDIGWFDVNGHVLESWEMGDRPPADSDSIQFDMNLGGMAFGEGVDIPLDIDVPGLELKVDGGFEVRLDWSFDFGFGISESDGFYLATNDFDTPGDAELEVNLGAYLDGAPLDQLQFTPFVAEGQLLFFHVTATDLDRLPAQAGFQPSGLYGYFEIDLQGDDSGRLSLTRLFTTPIEQVFVVDMGIEAGLNLDLILELEGVDGLPGLGATLVVDWGWSLTDGIADPEISLLDMRVDVGSFVSDFLKPISETIEDVLSPFRPVVDTLLAPIPGTEILLDDPTVLGLINQIAVLNGYPKIPPEFFQAAKTALDLSYMVNNLLGENGEIRLGSITGIGTDHMQTTSFAAPPNESLMNKINEIALKASGILDLDGPLVGEGGGFGAQQRSGFRAIEYITDIGNWAQLLTGGDAILFTYELPLLTYDFRFSSHLATITLGPAVINVSAVGGFTIGADLSFGYDTYGIRKALETGNPWMAFDGFFVGDYGIDFDPVKETIALGSEKDELFFRAEIG
ncbi:MAG: hypothetical protein VW804_01575, partial [Verrucomicrobiota bacterium]